MEKKRCSAASSVLGKQKGGSKRVTGEHHSGSASMWGGGTAMTLRRDIDFALPDPRFPELGVWADLAPHLKTL
jgi:hypothetical protein